jgi:hypothetical protein
VPASPSPPANAVVAPPPARSRPRFECVDRFFGAAGQGASSRSPDLSGDGRFLVAHVSSRSGGPFGDAIGVAVAFDRVRGKAMLAGRDLQQKPAPLAGVPRIANDGSYVVWSSGAANVVEHDTNGHVDVFLAPFAGGPSERVSVSSTGAEGDGDSGNATVSSGGRYVYFTSKASNLVADDTNGKLDLFVRDRTTKTTTRLMLSNDARAVEWLDYSLRLAADAGVVVFTSQDPVLLAVPAPKKGEYPPAPQIFVRALRGGPTECLSCQPARTGKPLSSNAPALSRNGRYIVFNSLNPDLDPASTADAHCFNSVYLFDREKRALQRVLCTDDNVEGLAVSDDAQTIAVSGTNADQGEPSPTFAGWKATLTFVRIIDRRTRLTADPMLGFDWRPGDGSFDGVQLSADGKVLAFTSTSTNLVPQQPKKPGDEISHVFIYDGLGLTSELERVPFDSSEP